MSWLIGPRDGKRFFCPSFAEIFFATRFSNSNIISMVKRTVRLCRFQVRTSQWQKNNENAVHSSETFANCSWNISHDFVFVQLWVIIALIFEQVFMFKCWGKILCTRWLEMSTVPEISLIFKFLSPITKSLILLTTNRYPLASLGISVFFSIVNSCQIQSLYDLMYKNSSALSLALPFEVVFLWSFLVSEYIRWKEWRMGTQAKFHVCGT